MGVKNIGFQEDFKRPTREPKLSFVVRNLTI